MESATGSPLVSATGSPLVSATGLMATETIVCWDVASLVTAESSLEVDPLEVLVEELLHEWRRRHAVAASGRS